MVGQSNHSAEIISVEWLKAMIGIMSMLLPVLVVFVVLITPNEAEINAELPAKLNELQPTISEFVYTRSNPIFVGFIAMVGFMFFAYRGYPENHSRIPISDNTLANIAGVGAMMTAFFPSDTCINGVDLNPLWNSHWIGVLHSLGAGMVFTSMGLFCLFYFTQSDHPIDQQSNSKRMRNRIYRICGMIVMSAIAMIVLIKLFSIIPECQYENRLGPIFWLETILVWAFGFAWLMKTNWIQPWFEQRLDHS